MNKTIMNAIICLSGLLFTVLPAHALEVEGVKLQDSIQLKTSSTPLLLNGAGIRSKFFFSIYVGALYLPEKKTSLTEILSQEKPNRISMHFLYDEVSKEKLTAGWTEGFEENNSTENMEKLKTRLETFNELFKTVVKNDVVTLDYFPDTGTHVSVNKEEMGTIPGADFNDALLKVWLGEEPADSDLKAAMLGGTEK